MGAGGLKPYLAKIFYVFFLAIGSLIAFGVGKAGELRVERDVNVAGLSLFEFSVNCDDLTSDNPVCSGEGAILRASFASVLFFSIMLVGTFPVPTFSGDRNWRPLLGEGFHRGFWGLKILIYFGLIIGSFFFSFFNEDAYTGVARFVSLIFLILQVLVLVDFAYVWNDTWIERSDIENDFADGSQCWVYALVGVSALLYLGSIGGIIAMLVLYNGCSSIIGIAATNLALIIFFTAITLARDKIVEGEVGGSIAPPAVVSFYIGYLTFSASISNPDTDEVCDPLGISLEQNGAEIFLSILFSSATLVWTAYTVSSNAGNLLNGTPDTGDRGDVGGAYEIQEADGTTKYARDADQGQNPYGDTDDDDSSTGDRLWFFHGIMITASFYMAMVLTNWGVTEVDVERGETGTNLSMYIKATAGWAAGLLYIWTIVAPAVLPDRDF